MATQNRSNLIFETEEDQFINPSNNTDMQPLTSTTETVSETESKPNKTISSYDEWLKTKRPEEDFLDLESGIAQTVKLQQEAMNRQNEPTALQKKYEEKGLEYDYTKRKEGESPYIGGIENPDFVQRNDESEKTVNVRDQLRSQYEAEMGRLNAVEVDIWADPEYAASAYGKRDMQLLRQRQKQIENYYNAEDAKLDGMFYEKLPPKDMNVANMLLTQGVNGKQLTYLVNNHGNIRDTVNEALLDVPEDKKEEFKTKLFGDYVRDDQGNIVRNGMGEELRKGGDLITVTPQGTYDYKISPNAYVKGVEKLMNQYIPQQDESKSVTKLTSYINKLQEGLEKMEEGQQKDEIKNTIDTLTNQRTNLIMQDLKGNYGNELFPTTETPAQKITKGVTMEKGTFVESPSGTTTEPTTTVTETKEIVTTPSSFIDNAIKAGYIKRDENGQLVLASETEQARKIFERAKARGLIK